MLSTGRFEALQPNARPFNTPLTKDQRLESLVEADGEGSLPSSALQILFLLLDGRGPKKNEGGGEKRSKMINK
jgi:hypothetical protein